jgi:Pectate lyase superfamily protein
MPPPRSSNAEGLLGIFYVLDFGATGDGQHDDSGGIQAAITAAGAAGGGLVAIPAGTYRLTVALSWGSGTNITIWQHSGATFTGAGSLPVAAGSNAIRVEPGGAVVGGVPTTSAVGDAAAAGAAATASATDHRHGREAFGGAAVVQAIGDAAAAGVALTPSRSDHRHGMPASIANANLATDVARANHSVNGLLNIWQRPSWHRHD